MINLNLFIIGGIGYGVLELLWRGYTHPSMLLTGGICLVIIKMIATHFKDLSLSKKSLLSGLSITAVEITVGLIVNIKLGLAVWDYSSQPFNIGGQVCLLYSLLWILLSSFLIKAIDFFQKKFTAEV